MSESDLLKFMAHWVLEARFHFSSFSSFSFVR